MPSSVLASYRLRWFHGLGESNEISQFWLIGLHGLHRADEPDEADGTAWCSSWKKISNRVAPNTFYSTFRQPSRRSETKTRKEPPRKGAHPNDSVHAVGILPCAHYLVVTHNLVVTSRLRVYRLPRGC